MKITSSTNTLLSNPNRAAAIPFSQYALYFFELKYIRLYLKGQPIDRREAWDMGYKNATNILQLQTPLDYQRIK